MSSHSQTISGPSPVTRSPAPPIVIFELNQARRAKVTREVEARRKGTLSARPEVDFRETLSRTYSSPSEPPAAFLERPTVEGLEAFAEKRIEYGEMMQDHVADLDAVIQEQFEMAQRLERAAKLAEERRLQEFQRALERMNPAEAEAARRAERERAFRLQRAYVARLAELDAEFARENSRAESPYDSSDEY